MQDAIKEIISLHLGKVLINENTKLMSILKKEQIPVNSVHHDIVDYDMNTLIINRKEDWQEIAVIFGW